MNSNETNDLLASLAAASVVGALALYRHHLTPRGGDVVAVRGARLLDIGAVPATVPPSMIVAIELDSDQPSQDDYYGRIVGFVHPETGEVIRSPEPPPGRLEGTPNIRFARDAITGLYRGSPLRKIS